MQDGGGEKVKESDLIQPNRTDKFDLVRAPTMADHGTCSHVSENGSGRITGAPTGSTRRRLPPLSIGRQLSAAGPLCNYLLRICMYIYIYIYFFSPLNFSFSFWHFLFAFIIHIEVNVSREKRTHFPFRRPHTLIHSSVAGSGQ